MSGDRAARLVCGRRRWVARCTRADCRCAVAVHAGQFDSFLRVSLSHAAWRLELMPIPCVRTVVSGVDCGVDCRCRGAWRDHLGDKGGPTMPVARCPGTKWSCSPAGSASLHRLIRQQVVYNHQPWHAVTCMHACMYVSMHACMYPCTGLALSRVYPSSFLFSRVLESY